MTLLAVYYQITLAESYFKMAAAFALAVVQETLERLDSYQDGDYRGILLRLEYLNRIIINCVDLLDSVLAGIGSAIHVYRVHRDRWKVLTCQTRLISS